MADDKIYLGDGAYAELHTFGMRISTSDGFSDTNVIYLEPAEFEVLVRFAKGHPRFADAINRAMA